VLRATPLAIGVALIAAAVALAEIGCIAAGWRVALFGLMLIAACLVERWRYQRLGNRHPGAGWIATAEGFVDPESGKLVTVYYRPATGARRYVAD
jgi:hypothetical protein